MYVYIHVPVESSKNFMRGNWEADGEKDPGSVICGKHQIGVE
jgi:hypothetical protein